MLVKPYPWCQHSSDVDPPRANKLAGNFHGGGHRSINSSRVGITDTLLKVRPGDFVDQVLVVSACPRTVGLLDVDVPTGFGQDTL